MENWYRKINRKKNRRNTRSKRKKTKIITNLQHRNKWWVKVKDGKINKFKRFFILITSINSVPSIRE